MLVSSPKAGIAIAGIREVFGCCGTAGAGAGGAGVWEITAADAGTVCDRAGSAGAPSRVKATSAMRSRRRIRCFTYLTDAAAAKWVSGRLIGQGLEDDALILPDRDDKIFAHPLLHRGSGGGMALAHGVVEGHLHRAGADQFGRIVEAGAAGHGVAAKAGV